MHFLIISNIRQKSLYFCFYTFLITLVQEQSFKKREYELNYGIMKQVTKTIIIMSIQMSWSHGTIQMSWSHAAIQMTWTHGSIQMSQSLFNSTTLDYFQGYFDSRFQCVFIGITIVHCFLCLYYFSLTIPHVFYQIQYSFKSSTVEKKSIQYYYDDWGIIPLNKKSLKAMRDFLTINFHQEYLGGIQIAFCYIEMLLELSHYKKNKKKTKK